MFGSDEVEILEDSNGVTITNVSADPLDFIINYSA